MYSSQNAGTLTPLEAPDLSLNVGNYSLYAPGNNSEGKAVPVFTGTTYSNLQNNNDYIWWTKNITVAGSSETIDMTLDHCCSQILVKLNASGDAVKGVTTMTLTPSSTQNSPWDLTTGVITPATALTAAMNMGITQKSDTLYYGQLIMMPLNATASSDSLTINIGVTYASGTQNYTAKLPVYKANSGASPAFKPGICYIYNLSISASGITIQTVDVTNWVDVTVNNEPIIPSQV